jgi:hypothetical protein
MEQAYGLCLRSPSNLGGIGPAPSSTAGNAACGGGEEVKRTSEEGTMRRVISVAAASLLIGLLTACGSDGDQLSEEEFLSQANEICQVGNEAINETFETFFEAFFPAGAEPTEEEVQQVIEENGQTILNDFVVNIRGQVDDIRDLNGPSDLEDELDPVLDEASEILDRISEAGPEEFFGGEGDEFAELDRELEALGLTACVE